MTTLSLRSPITRRAVLHYAEMWIAMGLGMAVLGHSSGWVSTRRAGRRSWTAPTGGR